MKLWLIWLHAVEVFLMKYKDTVEKALLLCPYIELYTSAQASPSSNSGHLVNSLKFEFRQNAKMQATKKAAQKIEQPRYL
jgi:hypothetical protein